MGTLVLTTILRAASELRRTRIDLPFLLGTMLTTDRKRAKALGYVMHFFFGFAFSLGLPRDLPRDGRGRLAPRRSYSGSCTATFAAHGTRQRSPPGRAPTDGRRHHRS